MPLNPLASNCSVRVWLTRAAAFISLGVSTTFGGVVAGWDFQSQEYLDDPLTIDAEIPVGNPHGGMLNVYNASTSVSFGPQGPSLDKSLGIIAENSHNLTTAGANLILELTPSANLFGWAISYDFRGGYVEGTSDMLWSYSVNNGVSFVDVQTVPGMTDQNWHSSGTINMSGAGTVNAGNTILFRISFVNGIGAGSGEEIDFANLQVSAVPEPVNMALAGFGLFAALVYGGRKLIAQKRS